MRGVCVLLVASTCLAGLTAVRTASADPAIPWGIDGTVAALTTADSTVYVGGAFSQVGPCSGGGVVGTDRTWQPIGAIPQFAGIVRAAIPDGDGGWFVGGQFAGVAGRACPNLAHLLRDGTVADWAPAPNAPVLGLLLSGTRLFVWGGFTEIGGQHRQYIAALDVPSAGATAWDAGANGLVACASLTHRGLIVGGQFTSIGGQARSHLARLDPVTAVAQPWNPAPNSLVSAIAVEKDQVIVAGDFNRLGSLRRNYLGSVDAATGAVQDWNPNPVVADLATPPPAVTAIVIQGQTMYLAGGFISIGGQDRLGLAAVDMRSGEVLPWDPQGSEAPYPFPVCYGLAVHGDLVYVGGTFTHVGGADRPYVAALDRHSARATPWNPQPNALAYVVVPDGNQVFLGGAFWSIGGQWRERNSLAAFDIATGSLRPWNPQSNAYYIRALRSAHGVIYAGGDFSRMGAAYRANVAALDPVTGVATSWNPGTDGAVWTIAADSRQVYLGGIFSSVGGMARAYAGSIEAQTGQVLPWNPSCNDAVNALAIAADRVYAGGFFTRIGGRLVKYLAALDPLSGQSLSWDAQLDGGVAALAVSGSRIFAGGYFNSAAGVPHPFLSGFDGNSAAALPWSDAPNGSVQSVVVRDSTVYAGGQFEIAGTAPREFLADFDSRTGRVGSWDPRANGQVWALCPEAERMFVGGDFNTVGYRQAVNLATVPLDLSNPRPRQATLVSVPRALSRVSVLPNPLRSAGAIEFLLARPAQVRLGVFDAQGRAVAMPVGAQFMAAGSHRLNLPASQWSPGCYVYRLDIDGRQTSGKILVVR